jgi:hypothetical protein
MKTELILPYFPGYYNSYLSDMVDQEVEMYLEDSGKTYDDIEDNLDYRAAYLAIARQWVKKFNDITGFNIEFVEMESPREYNFTTDKLVGLIPLEEVEKARYTAHNNLQEFQDALDMYFKSYDGFMSFYSNNIDDYIDKPTDELDHNEVMAYVTCALMVDGINYAELRGDICDCSSVYEAANEVFKC